MATSASKYCQRCKASIPNETKLCPFCGIDTRAWMEKHPALAVIAVLIALFISISIIETEEKQPIAVTEAQDGRDATTNSNESRRNVFVENGFESEDQADAFADNKSENQENEISEVENQIMRFAEREYPNDSSMQQYVFKNQIAAFHYIKNVEDLELKQFAESEYPNDYSMQKYVYENQLSAKNYMKTVLDDEIKELSKQEYPKDYSMQKYVYDNQLAAKEFMKNAENLSAKIEAEKQYPNDYSMQKYVYEHIAY